VAKEHLKRSQPRDKDTLKNWDQTRGLQNTLSPFTPYHLINRTPTLQEFITDNWAPILQESTTDWTPHISGVYNWQQNSHISGVYNWQQGSCVIGFYNWKKLKSPTPQESTAGNRTPTTLQESTTEWIVSFRPHFTGKQDSKRRGQEKKNKDTRVNVQYLQLNQLANKA
jgi:hypothetical protein